MTYYMCISNNKLYGSTKCCNALNDACTCHRSYEVECEGLVLMCCDRFLVRMFNIVDSEYPHIDLSTLSPTQLLELHSLLYVMER